MKHDRHRQIVQRRLRRNARYRRAFLRTLHKIDLAMLVREMREKAGFSQQELAERVGTTQSVIARLEDAEYKGQSLKMLEKIAAVARLPLPCTPKRNRTSTAKSCWCKHRYR